MNMFQAVGNCLANYATFSGRARRAEYWWFTFANVIMGLIFASLEAMSGEEYGIPNLYFLAALLPAIAVTTRRLHDTGRSGWWQLLGLIPLIGGLVLVVWLCQKGQPEANDWGENPLNADASDSPYRTA